MVISLITRITVTDMPPEMIPSSKHGNLIEYAGDSYIAAAYGASDLIVYRH